jgi:hypothetical protein
MVDFNMPVPVGNAIPLPSKFTIRFQARSGTANTIARARYDVLDPSIFFIERGFPTGEVIKMMRLSAVPSTIDRPVEIRSTVAIAHYFIQVTLEELDASGNVLSSKTVIMGI